MSSSENGRPLDPTKRRSPIGERVHFEEVVGTGSIPNSLGDLSDVDAGVSPALGSILAGNGAVFEEFPAGVDGQVIVYDSGQSSGLAVSDVVLNVGTDIDFLLENEPPEPDNNYTIIRTAGQVSREEWRRLDATLIKSIDYTRMGGQVTAEDRRVFDVDGLTLLGRLTVTYTRTGGQVTGAARVRVV